MTEKEWLACTDARTLLIHLHRRKRKPSGRKLRLFACACARAIGSAIAADYPGEYRELLQKGGHELIELSERLADGEAALDEVEHHCQAYLPQDFMPVPGVDFFAALAVTFPDAMEAARRATNDAALAIADPRSRRSLEEIDDDTLSALDEGRVPPSAARYPKMFKAEQKNHCRLLRDIIGNPFRSNEARLRPAQMGPTVHRLARAIYEDRDFERMPILADALEEAGCTDEAILSHCRGSGPHVRGCWALDLVLGKE